MGALENPLICELRRLGEQKDSWLTCLVSLEKDSLYFHSQESGQTKGDQIHAGEENHKNNLIALVNESEGVTNNWWDHDKLFFQHILTEIENLLQKHKSQSLEE